MTKCIHCDATVLTAASDRAQRALAEAALERQKNIKSDPDALARDLVAAGENEYAQGAFECMGRKQSLPEPGECNWPDCGCDPHATKVIESLLEQGWTGPALTSTERAPSLPTIDQVRQTIADEWGSHLCYRDSFGTRSCSQDTAGLLACRCNDIAHAILSTYTVSFTKS